ncbi:MAG: succinate dehydrogenase, cytochrome b556 subunit [Gammaproteobacteria bacterium]
MKDRRPTNIDLNSLRAYAFPLPAVTSILHRISGFALFLAIPFLLWLLDASLQSEVNFKEVVAFLDVGVVKFFLWLALCGLFYHVFAGVKHLLMDIGIGETLAGARLGSWIILGLSGFAALVLGVWLW